jgi:Uncharacterized protein conserved in bacteria (DUF2252)
MSSKNSIRPGDRASTLGLQQTLKMARSAHAYVRGSTVKFYEWLEAQKRGTLPEGPPVWICGDCHAGNLGPVAATDGRIDRRAYVRRKEGEVRHGERHDGKLIHRIHSSMSIKYWGRYVTLPSKGDKPA